MRAAHTLPCPSGILESSETKVMKGDERRDV